MESLFSWLSNLINFFGQFIPRLRICRKNFKGIKYVRGKHTVIINPGLFVYWPLTTEYELVPTATQILNLSVQSLLTRDNETIICDGCVCYKVADVEKFLVDNYDSAECINQLALASIREVLIQYPYASFNSARDEIEGSLTAQAKELIEEQLGVKIYYVKLVSLSPAKVINLVGGLTNSNSIYSNTGSHIIGSII